MIYSGVIKKGAGGASKCFVYERERRINEIQAGLGIRPVAGSLNIHLDREFDWDPFLATNFSVMDVVQRPSLSGDWGHFSCNFYPCMLIKDGIEIKTWSMRFVKDINRYPKNFIELISDAHLRQGLGLKDGDKVNVKTLLVI